VNTKILACQITGPAAAGSAGPVPTTLSCKVQHLSTPTITNNQSIDYSKNNRLHRWPAACRLTGIPKIKFNLSECKNSQLVTKRSLKTEGFKFCLKDAVSDIVRAFAFYEFKNSKICTNFKSIGYQQLK